jgi:hypothetical protein
MKIEQFTIPMQKYQPLFAILCLALGSYFYYGNSVDDAWISLRYAKNISDGLGPIFSPGQSPVEGYTNPLWVFIMSLLLLIKLDSQTILSCLCLIPFGLLSFLYFKFTNSRASIAVSLFTLFCMHSFHYWNFSGMESVCTSILILGWYIASTKNNKNLSLLFAALAIYCRPDSVLILSLLLIPNFISGTRQKFLYLLQLSAYGIPLAIYKLYYFNSIIPNTYYAKSSMNMGIALRGLDYIKGFFYHPELLVIFGITLFIAYNKKLPKTLLLLITVYFLYFIKTGGDFFHWFRFLVPIIPVWVFCLMEVLNKNARILFFYLMVFSFIGTLKLEVFETGFYEHRQTQILEQASQKLCPMYKEHTSAITAASGVINFKCNWNSHDLYGLTTPEIAKSSNQIPDGSDLAGHDKYDLDFVSQLSPEIIIPHIWLPVPKINIDLRKAPTLFDNMPHTPKALKELLQAEFLSKHYHQKQVQLDKELCYIWYEKNKE